MSTTIEWTDETWNPLTGCASVSPGCDHCYAARETAGRLNSHPAYAGLAVRPEGQPAVFTGEIRLHLDRLGQPLKWRKPRRVFVNSMSDLFHPDVPEEFIYRVFGVMASAQPHTFQILTKRPQSMEAWATATMRSSAWILPNVWLGTSIESDRYAFRADHLRRTPAAVRFLSLEPLLGPVPSLDLTGIDWVIVGGESGPRARPMHPDWVRNVRDRCVAEGVPFFFKQWGEWVPNYGGQPVAAPTALVDDGSGNVMKMWRVGKKVGGRVLDGRTWDQMPAGGAG